jgi:hypothetical protein
MVIDDKPRVKGKDQKPSSMSSLKRDHLFAKRLGLEPKTPNRGEM